MTGDGPFRAPASATRAVAETLFGLFAVQARQAPDRIAVSVATPLGGDGEGGGGGRSWTYGELARRAALVAASLRSRGVGPESRVGLALDRSPEALAAILGVLEAGAAYVPLDPEYPQERLAFMWGDCRRRPGAVADAPGVLLTRGDLVDRLAAVETEIVTVDGAFADEWSDEGAGGDRDGRDDGTGAGAVDGLARPGGLAYVIYTSGSTGRPKGVLIEHRGAVTVIRETVRLLGIGPESRVAQVASLSFDASVLEMFTALAAGAELVLLPRRVLLSGEDTARALLRHRVEAAAATPSLLASMPEGAEPELADLRALIVGAEACPVSVANRWAPGRRFFNAYAPTEATIYVTVQRCLPPFDKALPIGRPIGTGTVRLMDPDLVPVGAGETGELCLGGTGLARGYHGRPALTAERFVPDPLADRPGARLYRSGDLGRSRSDGALEFLGRIDEQVKIRGVRIELGEVEAVLAEHPGVRAAVAALKGGEGGGGARLVGYIVPRADAPGPPPAHEELRAFVSDRLPEAMVPRDFVLLESVPRTPTGKTDRSALPEPGPERPELDTPYAAPSNRTERVLCAVWEELLGIERVGVHDDLFVLGGHSLIVTRIASRVREELGRELPLLMVFEHPTVAALAERLDGGGPAVAEPELPPIEPAPRVPLPPASLPQERVWFLLQVAPSTIAYNFQFSVRFRGSFRPAALERALTETVRRHEVLRTTYPALDGRPVQEIHPPYRVPMPRIDLSALPEERRVPEAHRVVRREIGRGFDITRLPLFRVRLFVLSDEDHLFLQVEHHFVHDGWSLAVYLREVQELYRAYAAGRPSPLPEPEVQYADFAVWQRSWLEGSVFERQLDYWRAQLAGPLPELELPTDRPRPPAYSFRGGGLRVHMPPDLYADARRFGREQGMTLFMTMLAAFYALLHRLTGQEDMLLGSGLANRRHRQVEDLVGMVVNTVVLRARPRSRQTFRGLLEEIRRTTLEAHLHQDMPFERLVQDLQPERDLSRNPLFQVLFSFHDAAVPDLEMPELGLSGELFEWHNGSAKSDLNVVVKPLAEQRVGRRPTGGEDLTMVWEYSGDILDRSTVQRMWGHYQELLRGAFCDPHRPLAELPLLTAAEHRQIRAWSGAGAVPAGEWAAPSADRFEPVHLRVARRARERPEAIAVASDRGALRYGDLVARAGALAARLRSLPSWGGPESVVALLAGRAPETAVGALGILAAGGAYLPIDPEYPAERIAFMVERSGAVAVVAREDLVPLLPPDGPALLEIGSGSEPGAPSGASEGAAEIWRRPDRPAPDALAYVIYTSGSTGEPKGVELTHGGLANLVDWHRDAYGSAPEDRATLVAGPGFDAAVWELWPAIATGAALHVPSDAVRMAPEKLLAWMAAEGITLSFLPTPLAEGVIEEIRRTGLPEGSRLRAVLTGGDRLRRRPPEGLPFRLVNHYGPTESTVVATAGEVPAEGGTEPDGTLFAPSIGRPISGLRVQLLDRNLVPVPAGVPGELCVGGRGLARGYRRRAAWTAAAFVPDPLPPEATPTARTGQVGGDRLYRTGDLARWLPDGRIDFLRRIDSQVQVRGFRVELGEIESALVSHPAIREAAVVTTRSGGDDALRLVGSFVSDPAAGASPCLEDLSAYLAARLPGYMVPSLLVPVESIPLTAHGKVDRRALAELAELAEAGEPEGAGDEGTGFVPPRTRTEEVVSDIWAAVLKRDRVGVRDDFFALGGHSLLATRVLARVRDAYGVDVPLVELFDGPTVAELASTVERFRGEA